MKWHRRAWACRTSQEICLMKYKASVMHPAFLLFLPLGLMDIRAFCTPII